MNSLTMYSRSTNQIQSGDDEKEEDQPEDGDNSIPKDSAIKQTFFSYYNNQHFVPTLKSAVEKSPDFVCRKRKPPAHGGKDRHSKVRTARGPRDRRLRLSPTTAIQFYDVQDRLGYDRPSKAIDWLIQEAKTAIDALSHHPNAAADNPVSPSSEFQAYLDQDFNAASQILELQKMLTWNCENENSGNAGGGGGGTVDASLAAQPNSGTGDMFCEREPLQSINTDFPEFSFYNELSNITASAILKKEDEKDYKLGPSSSSPFLHFED